MRQSICRLTRLSGLPRISSSSMRQAKSRTGGFRSESAPGSRLSPDEFWFIYANVGNGNAVLVKFAEALARKINVDFE